MPMCPEFCAGAWWEGGADGARAQESRGDVIPGARGGPHLPPEVLDVQAVSHAREFEVALAGLVRASLQMDGCKDDRARDENLVQHTDDRGDYEMIRFGCNSSAHNDLQF